MHTGKRETTKSYLLDSRHFQVLLQGITHFSALGAAQRTTSVVRLQQWLGFPEKKSKICQGQGVRGWKEGKPVHKTSFLGSALSLLQKAKFIF